MTGSRKMSGGQTSTVTPKWLNYINTEYAKIAGGGKKSAYLNNVIGYFTGGGKADYPAKSGNGLYKNDTNNTVALIDLASLDRLELVSLDPRRIAMQQCIQQNLVENAATSGNRFNDMNGPMNALKNDSRFGMSEYYDNYPAEEREVWAKHHVPILTKSHPVYQQLLKIMDSSESRDANGGLNYRKYYIAVLNFSDFFNKFYGLTKTQLTDLKLPTYDRRRLTICSIRQSFKESLCGTSPQSASALTAAINPLLVDPDKNPSPMSWPMVASEKTAYTAVPAKECLTYVPPEPMLLTGGGLSGGRRRHRKTRRARGSRRH
jgi:hypothetical protein